MPLSWTSALANDRTTRTPLTSRIRKNWRNNAMYVAYLNSGSFPCLFDGPHVDRQHMDGYNTIQYNTSTGSRTASDSSLSVTRTELLFHTESPLYPAINSMDQLCVKFFWNSTPQCTVCDSHINTFFPLFLTENVSLLVYF